MAANGLLSVLLAPTCAACGAVLDAPLEGCVCRNCWAAIVPASDLAFGPGSPIEALMSIGSYEGALRRIIHALKYQGRRSVAGHLGRLMRARAGDALSAATCVVPVPLHWRREYARGFNQASEIGRHLGLPVVNALRRRRATAPQVHLAKEARFQNVQGAFELRRAGWRRGGNVDDLTVILVDDVSTTGATLFACAGALKSAGAARVWALTAARRI